MHAWLETTGVAGQRLRFPLDRETLRVGSVGTSDVWIPLPGIRRLHCRIEPEGRVWRVRPAKGATVTVNGREHEGPAALAVGDRLEIGRVSFSVRDDAVEIDVVAPAAGASVTAAAASLASPLHRTAQAPAAGTRPPGR